MKRIISYLCLILLFSTSCSDDDNIIGTIPNSKPAKTYKIMGADPILKTIEVGDGKLYVGGWSASTLPIAHIDSDKIREGASKNGKIIAEIKGNQIFGKSKDNKDFTATIDGSNIINGPTKYGYRIGFVDYSSGDIPTVADGALGAVFFLYFSNKEFSDKNYTYIINPQTQSVYAIIENGKLFSTKNTHTPQAYIQGDTVYRNKEIVVIKNGNQIIEPVSKGVIATVDGKKVIRHSSGNNETLAIIDGNDLAAGALAVAAHIINKDIYITSRITNNYSVTTRATVYLDSLLFEGNGQKGKPLALLNGDKIIKGDTKDGEVIAVMNGKQVIKGQSKDGKVIAEIEDNKITLITASGKQTVIGRIFDSDNNIAGVLGAVYFLLIDMPNDPTWITSKQNIYTKAIIYENKLYKGGSADADPLAILDGNNIIKGGSNNGKTIAIISGNSVIKDGNVIAEIGDNLIVQLSSSGKKTVIGHYYGNENIRMGALGAVYLILLDNSNGNSSEGGSSGGGSATTEPTYIRQGTSSNGQKVATVYDGKLMKGSSQYGTTVAVLDGKSIVSGSSKYGSTIAVIDGNNVVKGSSKYGTVIANINGTKIIEGSSKYGKTIGTIDGNGGVNAGALGAVYLILLDNSNSNASEGGSSGGGSATTKPTYIRQGTSSNGQKVATVYDGKLMKGSSQYGTTVAVLNGKSIVSGSSKYGSTIAVIDGNNVVKGSSKNGTVIANINGTKIIEGSSKYGKTIGTIDGNGGVNAGALGAVYLLLLN